MEKIEKRAFGKTGLPVSCLGFGAAPVGLLSIERERVAHILTFLLDHGVNFIDTAAAYAGSEALIGEFISDRREEFVLISKCGRSLPDLPGEDWSEDLITRSIERSLQRLRTDRLDVILLHSCDLPVLQKGEAWRAVLKARDAGKARFAGYSGDNDAAAYALTLPEIAALETSVSIADQANIDLVLPKAQEAKVGVIAKRPIANAAWRQPEQQQGMYKNYAAPYHDRLRQMKLDPVELGMQDRSSDSWNELALRFTLTQPGVQTAIVGTTNADNAKRNIQVAQAGPLAPGTVAAIRDAFRRAEAAAGKKWEGLG